MLEVVYMWLCFSYCDIKLHLFSSGYSVTRSFWPSFLDDIVFWLVQCKNNAKGPVQSRQERKILASFWNDIQYKKIHQIKHAELL